MTLQDQQNSILWWPPKNIHKSSYLKNIIFSEKPKNIEIQNFEPPKMTRTYVCMKISEYPLGLDPFNRNVIDSITSIYRATSISQSTP